MEGKSNTYILNKYNKKLKEREQQIFQELIKAFEIDIIQQIRNFPRYKEAKETFNRDYLQKEDYEGEEWKDIYKLNYQISNYGRIKNKTTKKLKQLKFNRYGMQVILWQNSKSYNITISRLVAEFFIRHVNEDERVSHINKNIRDNYYKNLKIIPKKRKETNDEGT